MISTALRHVMCCSPRSKAIILTPTLVRSFPREDERNSDYTYLAGPKKEVVLMGNRAFDGFLASIQAKIGNLIKTITVFEKRVVTLRKKVAAGNTQAATDLATTED